MSKGYCNVFNRECSKWRKNPVEAKRYFMKLKLSPRQKQGNFLYQDLLEPFDLKDPLLLLAKKIPWEMFEREFAPLYAGFGWPAKPIQLMMVGLLLLKQIENLSDERVVEGASSHFL